MALVLSLFLSVRSADAQQNGLPINPSTRNSPPSRHFYAVIGAVGVPGVYEFSTGLPTLANVIHAADGLTIKASGTFRIVREGKISRQMIYSPDSEILLLSEDILVLHNSPTGREEKGPSSVVSESQSQVQIVALNLIHRPVVMILRSEDATLERLVTLLNQSPNIIPTIKVLQAKTSEYVGPGKDLAKFRLLPETVLVFDPSVIQIDQIPELPATYKPKVRTASFRKIHDSSSENSLGNNSKHVVKLAADSSSQGHGPQLDQAEMMLRVPPPLESAHPPQAKLFYDNPADWNAVNGKELSMDPPDDGWKNVPESATAPVSADPLVIHEHKKEIPDSTETSTVAEETSEKITLSVTRVKQGLIVVGCVGLLGAGWFFRRKIQQRVNPQLYFQPVKNNTGGILDALMENKLSLFEESFIFPEGLKLQVPAASTVRTVPTLRTAPPVSQKKFRVDSSQTLLQPHLPSEVEEPVPDWPHSVTKTSPINAVPEPPSVVSGLSEPVEILQQTSDAPQSKALRPSTTLNTETDQTRFPGAEQFTAYVYSTSWPESASELEPAVVSDSDSPSRTVPNRNESTSTSSEQTNRIDSAQTTSLRPHARHSGWVLDRVLVALHGVTRQ